MSLGINDSMDVQRMKRKEANDIGEKFQKQKKRFENGDINEDTFKRYSKDLVKQGIIYREAQDKKTYIDLINNVLMTIQKEL